MKRGEIWTVSGSRDYASKPRPALIIQDDAFSGSDSITVCPLTSDETDAPLFRVLVSSEPSTGLRHSSRLMIDKITTVPKTKLGRRVGALSPEDMVRAERAILAFLGLSS